MPTVACPIEGLEDVKITFPDEWLIKHNEIFWAGVREAGENVTWNTGLLYGCIAVVKIEGLDSEKPGEWPLQVFNWIIQTIYYDSLHKALNPEKNSSSPAPTMPST